VSNPDDVASWTAAVERLRAGHDENDCDLEAIAAFFGAPPGYFGDDPGVVAEAQDMLLSHALRECGLRTYVLCRSLTAPGLLRRELLRRALERLRSRWRPDTDHHIVGTEVDTPPAAPLPWEDQADRSGQQRLHPSRAAIRGGRVRASQRPMSEAQLRTLCIKLLHDLDILPPLTPELLCQKLGQARGRRLKLVADELYTTSSVGHLFSTARRDVIAYQRSATRPQQAHVIYHEVIHLVLEHFDGTESLTCGALDATDMDGEHDGLYTRWQEWEAETAATILSELSAQRADPRLIPKDPQQADRSIAAAFGLIRDGWR
jgi:hypothetical protein